MDIDNEKGFLKTLMAHLSIGTLDVPIGDQNTPLKTTH